MADKLAELLAALEGMSDEGLRIVAEFAEYLAKQQSAEKERTKVVERASNREKPME